MKMNPFEKGPQGKEIFCECRRFSVFRKQKILFIPCSCECVYDRAIHTVHTESHQIHQLQATETEMHLVVLARFAARSGALFFFIHRYYSSLLSPKSLES